LAIGKQSTCKGKMQWNYYQRNAQKVQQVQNVTVTTMSRK